MSGLIDVIGGVTGNSVPLRIGEPFPSSLIIVCHADFTAPPAEKSPIVVSVNTGKRSVALEIDIPEF